MMRDARLIYTPTEESLRRVSLMRTIIKISYQGATKHWDALGRCLILLNNYEAGSVALEQTISKTESGMSHPALSYDSCPAPGDISGTRYVAVYALI